MTFRRLRAIRGRANEHLALLESTLGAVVGVFQTPPIRDEQTHVVRGGGVPRGTEQQGEGGAKGETICMLLGMGDGSPSIAARLFGVASLGAYVKEDLSERRGDLHVVGDGRGAVVDRCLTVFGVASFERG